MFGESDTGSDTLAVLDEDSTYTSDYSQSESLDSYSYASYAVPSVSYTHIATSNNSVLTQSTTMTSMPSAPSLPVQVGESSMAVPTDPGVSAGNFWTQWQYTGTYGINVQGVWDDYTGQGVRLAVFDDGFMYTHNELAPNYNTALDWDTLGDDNNAINVSGDTHGTRVSQVMAGAADGSETVGVAFDSEIIGIRRGFGAESSTQDTLEGFEYARTVGADVMNNSWGTNAVYGDNKKLNFTGTDPSDVHNEIENLVNLGRGGLGTSIVISAGNSRGDGIQANDKNYQNSIHTITVGALASDGTYASFSSAGANLLLTAPGQAIPVVFEDQASKVNISGTSFSAPIVSGVIGLMYEANADLGYRDVQEILALSSRQVDASGTGWAGEGWQFNGATNWNGGGMHFSHDYGYGNVDTLAAVRLAETWTQQQTFSNMTTLSAQTESPNLAIPSIGTVTDTMVIATDIEIEQVIIDLDIDHARLGDVQVTLTSPDGTDSILIYRPENGNFVSQYGFTGVDFEFSSTAHWGESSAGTWTLTIEDTVGGNAGTLQEWSLSFVGNAHSANDFYYYTNEFAGMSGSRTVLNDSSGTDTINVAAVSSGTTIDLTAGTATIAGTGLTINGTIEHVYTGDGNDTITGNTADNTLDAGRGDDTALYAQDISEFDFNFINATTVEAVHTGSLGTDTLINFETYRFNGTDYTYSELQDYMNNGGSSTALTLDSITILMTKTAGGAQNVVSDTNGIDNYTGNDLGLQAYQAGILNVTRSVSSINIEQVVQSGSQYLGTVQLRDTGLTDITVNGFYQNRLDESSATEDVSMDASFTVGGNIKTGSGNDTVVIAQKTGSVTSSMGSRSWRVDVGDGDDTITLTGSIASTTVLLYLGAGDDVLNSSFIAAHYILAGDGGDVISVGAGDDLIYGEGDNDDISGGDGYDRLYGGAGQDILNGDNGNDYLNGGADNDDITGGDGEDIIDGGDGDDIITGGNDDDDIAGGSGIDDIEGGSGRDYIQGGLGADIIDGGIDDDRLYGGGDGDTIDGDNGNDKIYGEDGNDTLRGGNGVDTIDGGIGDDLIYGDLAADFLLGDAGNDTIYGGVQDDKIYGGADNDRLYGEGGIDTIDGDEGNDVIHGGDGNDLLYGGSGNDFLWGGAGNDKIYAESGDNVILLGEGRDRVYAGTGVDTFEIDIIDNYDRIYNFNYGQDRLNLSDILTGYTDGVSDINDFIQVYSGGYSSVYINQDGVGNDAVRAMLVYSNFGGASASDLVANGTLIVNGSSINPADLV